MRKVRLLDVTCIYNIVMQALDGALTYVGVGIHGLEIEGNPIVKYALSELGPLVGMCFIKGLAITVLICILLVPRKELTSISNMWFYYVCFTAINVVYSFVVYYWIKLLAHHNACVLVGF